MAESHGLSAVTAGILESQLKGLAHDRTRAGAVATLLLLLPRVDPSLAPVIKPYIGTLTALLNTSSSKQDPSIQANAAAVLGAIASLTDDLHAAVDESAAEPITQLMHALLGASAGGSTGAAEDGGGGGGGGGAEAEDGGGINEALAVNVLSAVAQLAREQGHTYDKVKEEEGLHALIALGSMQQPDAVMEAALDALCAVACHDGAAPAAAEPSGGATDARTALLAAGAVEAVAGVVAGAAGADSLVRALMLLGMLVTSSAEGRRRLVEAHGGSGAVRLLGLAAQNDDADCKVIARDLLGLLMRDPELRPAVEAAVRRAAEGLAAPAAGGAAA